MPARRIYYLFTFFLFLASCNEDDEKDKNIPNEEPVRISSGCYRMIIQKDTALLQLHVQDTLVSGNLIYNRFEKDDNTGSINGIIAKEKIIAWYTYQSEGVTSLRQVIFKLGNNELFEGYGEFIGSEDSAAFRFPEALRYEENHPYQKVSCNEAGF